MRRPPGLAAGFVQVLRTADFLRLWIGQVVSMLGDRLDQMGIVALYAAVGYGSVTSALAMLAIAPQLAVSMIAGHVIDRYDRRWVLIASDALRATLVLMLPLAFRVYGTSGVYAVVLAVGTATAFFTPAKSSIIPRLVTTEALPAANGFSVISNILATLIGSFIGVHLAHDLGVDHGKPPTPFFMIDAATYVVSAFLVWRIVADLRPGGGQEQAPRRRLASLRRFLASNPEIYWMLGAAVLFWTAAAVVYSAINGFAYVRFHRGIIGIGNMQASLGVGMLLGAFLAGRDHRRSFAAAVWPLMLGTSIALWILDYAARWGLALISVVAVGVFAAWLIILVDTELQRATPDALRGRIFGLKQQLTAVAFIIPGVAFHYDSDIDHDLPRLMVASLSVLALAALVFMVRAAWQALERARRADWGVPWLNRLDGLNRILCKRLHGLEVEGLALPPSGGLLLAANHISGLDPMILIASVNRPLRFLIAEDEFERWWLKWLFRAMGCIPVRTGHSQHVFTAAKRALEAGEVVALFPEGGIHRPGQFGHLKRGVALMAEQTGAPVFTAHITGVRGAGLKILAVFLPDRVRVRGFPGLPYRDQGITPFLDEIARRLDGHVP